jgi:cell division protein FtsQ
MRLKRKARFVRLLSTAAVIGLVATALGGVVIAGSMICDAPGLRIAHIYVNGCEASIAEDVLASAEPYRSENILAVDLGSLRHRLENNPWIEQAVIRRQYPDTLAIAISVRKARALLSLDRDFLVDADGAVFTEASGPRMDLPVLQGLQRSDFETDPAAAARLIRDGLQIVANLRLQDFPVDDDVRIDCSGEFGFTLHLGPAGPDVFLGFGNYQNKLSVLPQMLADLHSRGLSARSIHLHSPERAFVQLDGRERHTRQAQAEKSGRKSLPS